MSQPNDPKNIHHVYDDIEEEDNRLPNWWLATLFGTIVFSFGYWFVYHNGAWAQHPIAEYETEVAAIKSARAAVAPTGEDALLALAKDAAAIKDGAVVFSTVCFTCHGQKGEGLVGPNLTDDYWVHGSSAAAIHKVVAEGVTEKGMPGWEKTIGADKVRQVTAYVLTLKGTKIAGKAPQGTTDDGTPAPEAPAVGGTGGGADAPPTPPPAVDTAVPAEPAAPPPAGQ